MNKNNLERGKIKTKQKSQNRFASSRRVSKKNIPWITIIAMILILISLTCVIFVAFVNENVPVGNFDDSEQTLQKSPYIASVGGEELEDNYLKSKYAILIQLSDMTTIAHYDADVQFPPASMTKVMTVITALDLIENLDDEYIFTPEVLTSFPKQELLNKASTADMFYMYDTYLGVLECERYTIRDLIYGISYRSGADSIVCLLDYLKITMEDFVGLMNKKAVEIGLENTYFGGAIGRDLEGNKTTCRDMAAIMVYAMENPLCKEFFGGVSYRLKYVKTVYYNRTLYNTLNYMGKTPDNVLGGKYSIIATKSGLEDAAGYCLVSCILNNETGELYVLVTAKAEKGTEYTASENPIFDMQKLFDKFTP